MNRHCLQRLALAGLLLVSPASAQNAFVHWETPHVTPLGLTPDGTRLLAANTPDDRLEVFDVTGPIPVRLFDVPVGLDPVSVRARTNDEVWVVNHISDSVSVVHLPTRRVLATLRTSDEPADVIFAGVPERAFVSCSQANEVLVFDPQNLAAVPLRIPILGEDPRALAVSPDGARVYVAIHESGNSSTVLGGGAQVGGALAFPPNVVNNPGGPHGGVNPPPNSGAAFSPPQNPLNPAPPRVGLIVKKDALGRWMDDNGGNWSALVSGPNASLSGRLPGWDLTDNDVAVIQASSLSVSYARRLMNAVMALAVNPASGEVTPVGTDGTNQIRFEPVVNGKFVRVQLARVDGSSAATLGLVDLNPHLDYSTSTLPPDQRTRALGDPRGIAWNSTGTRAYVSGMGSNNLVVIDATGARAGTSETIPVGEGPTGVALHPQSGRLFVLAKFESAICVVDLASETEIARVSFHNPEPQAIRVGRKHLYNTHANSGLGQAACGSCHIDGRQDRLAWDLGAPDGDMKALTGQNLGFGFPGLTTGFQPWHPMKGPMTTQTLQGIIGLEPLHWRGDRAGLEEFNGAFVGLQGNDSMLSPQEMQEFESFLATVRFPPNPFRNFDNTLPTNLPLPGHFTTGRFGPPGLPLPNGNAVAGLAAYRPPNLLDGGAFACSTCHTLPTGAGSDFRLQGGQYVPIAPGPNGERHHGLVSVDGSTNVSIKIPQLRNLYEKTGFNATQLLNTAGFGLLHDGSVDSIERFVSEPVFNVTGNQMVADLTAFMLAFSGSDLPANSGLAEPPGSVSLDTHAAVGHQTTLVSAAGAPPAQITLIGNMLALADAGRVGVVVKGLQAGLARGYTYMNAQGFYQSDRAAETLTAAQLLGAAAAGSELTWTVVPLGTQLRIGVDRDSDGYFDRDELDAGSDPADPLSTPGGCAQSAPTPASGLTALALSQSQVNLTWMDNSSNEDGFSVERSPAGQGQFQLVVNLPAGSTSYPDTSVACGTAYDWRVRAFNCAGASGFASASATTQSCCGSPSNYCIGAPNSFGAGAVIGFQGSTSVAANDLVLTITGAVPGNVGMFFYGAGQTQIPFNDGFLCVSAGGVGVFRLWPPQIAGGAGNASFALDLTLPPAPGGQIVAGSTWNFQYWYRDPAGVPGTGANLSDALSATFCP